MSDRLIELLGRHHRHGELMISCDCGWWADAVTAEDQLVQYDHHLADVIRTYRRELPVIRTADERIQAEIRQRGQQIRARKSPLPAFHPNTQGARGPTMINIICGDIGEKEDQREWELEPLTIPQTKPIVEPAPAPEREPVPA